MGWTELTRVVEIDRRERINVLCDQHGTQLVARHGNWSASAWDPDGHGEHSVEAKVHALQHHVDSGGIALGVLASGRLVGIGVVVPHLRPGIPQLQIKLSLGGRQIAETALKTTVERFRSAAALRTLGTSCVPSHSEMDELLTQPRLLDNEPSARRQQQLRIHRAPFGQPGDPPGRGLPEAGRPVQLTPPKS